MTKRVLITGASGFIASHVVADFLRNTDWKITLLDRLGHSGNRNRLASAIAGLRPIERLHWHDLRSPISAQFASQLGAFDYILHLAAATHVDRSIDDPLSFVMDNVVATCNMLNFARETGCALFLQFSTDEVFGPAPLNTRYAEWDRYNSGNPYAATKAGAEELAVSFENTYKLPVVVTHTMNVIGRMQHPEKFVPLAIRRIRDGGLVTIHADPTKTRAGSRFYIHADDVASALRHIVSIHAAPPWDADQKGAAKYNIVGAEEIDNLALAQRIAKIMDKPLIYEMVDFHSQRPGHDLRYALDGGLLASTGWMPRPLDDTLESIVSWSLKHPEWL